jgi:chloramphenicol 3-O phosphotransferase
VVIVLNGASSAGKTSLARALQNLLPTPHLVLGIDTVLSALPYPYRTQQWPGVFRYEYSADGRLTAMRALPFGTALVQGLHAAVAALARAGLDVILDHVLVEPAWAADLQAALADLPVLRVGVLCPPHVLAAREQSRGDREIGQAVAQLDTVHAALPYDLTVDTSLADPTECADRIWAAVDGDRSH